MIFSVTPSQIQPNISASINIAGVNFGDPALGASDTVEICPLSNSGAISGGCSSIDVTPASDTLIAVDVSLQAAAYGYAVTVISDEDDEESNQATLGVSTSAPIIYDTPPNIASVVPGDIPALSGQAVAIVGTNLGNAGTLSICQGSACLPYTISDWGNTEVDVIVDASAATPGTSYTVSLSTTVDSLGNAFLAAPGSPADTTSSDLLINVTTPIITSVTPSIAYINTNNVTLTILGTGFGLTPQVGLPIGFINARNQVNFLDGTQIRITADISLQATIGNGPISVSNSGKIAVASFAVNGPYYMVVQSDTGQTVMCVDCKSTVQRQVLYQVLNFDRSIASGASVCEAVKVNSYSCSSPATFPGFDVTACTAPLVLGADGLFEDDWSLNDTFTPAGCGVTDVDTWQWAGSAASFPQILGTLNGIVNTNVVTINGNATGMTPGTVISH